MTKVTKMELYTNTAPENTLEDLQRDAGEELTDVVIGLFEGGEESALKWFYSANVPALGHRTPYQACEDGDHGDVEGLVYGLEHGAFL